MLQKLCFLLLVSLYSCMVSAQKIRKYFNSEWKACKDTEAVYFTEQEKRDSLWYRVDYSANTLQLVKHGFYKDDACTIKHGIFEYFFGNGSISDREQYEDNKKTGFNFSVYPNGIISDSFYFKKNIPYGICSSWYPNGSPRTEMQMDTLGNGSGLVIGFFIDGTVSFKGKLASGLRKTGNWFYYHPNGQRAAVLQYGLVDSSLQTPEPQVKFDMYETAYYDSTITYKNAICYDTAGVQQPGCKIENKYPEYAKGLKGWSDYLSGTISGIMGKHGNLAKPVRYLSFFIVNANSDVSDILLDNTVNNSFDADIISLFKKAKKWKPAIHNNRFISFLHKQSLTLGVNF